MTILNEWEVCGSDQRLSFDGMKSHNGWLDVALESEENTRLAIKVLDEEYGITFPSEEEGIHDLREEDISFIVARTIDQTMISSILDKKEGIYFVDEKVGDDTIVLSFSCKMME